jgi:hypothetical protein
MWYDERGQGDPLVALRTGGAGVDSRALTPQLEALALCNTVITEFFTKDPTQTFAPIRRAAPRRARLQEGRR